MSERLGNGTVAPPRSFSHAAPPDSLRDLSDMALPAMHGCIGAMRSEIRSRAAANSQHLVTRSSDRVSKVYVGPLKARPAPVELLSTQDTWYVKYLDGSELRFLFPPSEVM